MPRKRNKENEGLPRRWKHYHGAYYYQVPPGQEIHWDGKKTFPLGKKLADAHREWAKRIEAQADVKTCGQLLDRYMLEVVPKKALRTQADNIRYAVNLRKQFGDAPKGSIKPALIYHYDQWRGGTVQGRREIEMFSHMFTWAVRWGELDAHPFLRQVRFEGEEAEKPRDRYIEDWEVIEALNLPSKRRKGSVLVIRAYICIKLILGIRRADMLRLRPGFDFAHDLSGDGIYVKARKTAKTTSEAKTFKWTPELRQAVQMALDARPVDIAPWLFCTRKGECYVKENGMASGWDSMWGRFMDRVLKETKVTERFTEHDLRGKTGSDEEDLERARKILGHADAKMTKKAYRRKAEVLEPAKAGAWWKK